MLFTVTGYDQSHHFEVPRDPSLIISASRHEVFPLADAAHQAVPRTQNGSSPSILEAVKLLSSKMTIIERKVLSKLIHNYHSFGQLEFSFRTTFCQLPLIRICQYFGV